MDTYSSLQARWPARMRPPSLGTAVLSAGSPGRFSNTWHRNHFLTLAEIRSTSSAVFWPRSGPGPVEEGSWLHEQDAKNETTQQGGYVSKWDRAGQMRIDCAGNQVHTDAMEVVGHEVQAGADFAREQRVTEDGGEHEEMPKSPGCETERERRAEVHQ